MEDFYLQCALTDSYDIALAAENIDIYAHMFDGMQWTVILITNLIFQIH